MDEFSGAIRDVAQYICQDSKLLVPVFCFHELFEPVYGSCGWSNMLRTLDFYPDQPGRNQIHQKAKKSYKTFSRSPPRKRFVGPEIFLRFEAELDFSRP